MEIHHEVVLLVGMVFAFKEDLSVEITGGVVAERSDIIGGIQGIEPRVLVIHKGIAVAIGVFCGVGVGAFQVGGKRKLVVIPNV